VIVSPAYFFFWSISSFFIHREPDDSFMLCSVGVGGNYKLAVSWRSAGHVSEGSSLYLHKYFDWIRLVYLLNLKARACFNNFPL
jgi:hypothetical protein